MGHVGRRYDRDVARHGVGDVRSGRCSIEGWGEQTYRKKPATEGYAENTGRYIERAALAGNANRATGSILPAAGVSATCEPTLIARLPRWIQVHGSWGALDPPIQRALGGQGSCASAAGRNGGFGVLSVASRVSRNGGNSTEACLVSEQRTCCGASSRIRAQRDCLCPPILDRFGQLSPCAEEAVVLIRDRGSDGHRA